MHKTGAAVPEGQEFTIAGLAKKPGTKAVCARRLHRLADRIGASDGGIRERPARPTPRVRPGLRHRDGRNRFAHLGLAVRAVLDSSDQGAPRDLERISFYWSDGRAMDADVSGGVHARGAAWRRASHHELDLHPVARRAFFPCSCSVTLCSRIKMSRSSGFGPARVRLRSCRASSWWS